DGKLPFHGFGGKGVVLDLIAVEMCHDVVFELLVIGAPDGPRSKGGDLFRVLDGASSVDFRCVRYVDGGTNRIARCRRGVSHLTGSRRSRRRRIVALALIAGSRRGENANRHQSSRATQPS